MLSRFKYRLMLLCMAVLLAHCQLCHAAEALETNCAFVYHDKTIIVDIDGTAKFIHDGMLMEEDDEIAIGRVADSIVPLNYYGDCSELAYYSMTAKRYILICENAYGTPFCSGYAAFVHDHSVHIMDSHGHRVKTIENCDVVEPQFANQLPFVLRKEDDENSQYFLFDPAMNTTILLSHAIDVGAFSENLCSFKAANGLYGYINTKGEIVIPPDYVIAADFVDGNAYVQGKNMHWYIIDPNGGVVSEIESFQEP